MVKTKLGWDREVGETRIVRKTSKTKAPRFMTMDQSDYQRFFEAMEDEDTGASGTAFFMWMVIVNLRRAYGQVEFEIRPKNIQVPQISSKQITRSLEKLEALGLIRYERSRGKTRRVEVLESEVGNHETD